MTMTHPGLPTSWGIFIFICMGVISIWAILKPSSNHIPSRYLQLNNVPLIGAVVKLLNKGPWPLFILKVISSIFFVLIISAGLFGTVVPERNIATTFTWTIWWTGLIISIYFIGSAWCAICPWDAIASWLVKRRLWRRNDSTGSLGYRVPKIIRNIWPALFMFIGLTWLELGVGVTASPYATALMALFMVVAATVSLSIFERKAFCRHFCPIGRTIGFYAQLSAIELRPTSADVCSSCDTLDCYHGNDDVDPCPTHLVMGRLDQNTYCTSCGACLQSCPHSNISWRLHPTGTEARIHARPHWDEAWFILGLAGLTSFHGITMMPFWEQWVGKLAYVLGDSGQLLWSFSIGMVISMLIPVLLYTSAIAVTRIIMRNNIPFRQLFMTMVFAALPIAFSYHIAHNLNHLINEFSGIGPVLMNPFGTGTLPLSMAEIHEKHLNPLIPAQILHLLQSFLMISGFWLAIIIVRSRANDILQRTASMFNWHLLPMILFVIVFHLFDIWLLMKPMIMRI